VIWFSIGGSEFHYIDRVVFLVQASCFIPFMYFVEYDFAVRCMIY
jgi:hypothetical protein